MKPSSSPPHISLPERHHYDGAGPFSPPEDVVSSAVSLLGLEEIHLALSRNPAQQ